MTRANSQQLTPERVRSAAFSPARLGRRGLDEAHASASRAASTVRETQEPLPASERQELEAEIAYLRTFSDVCRTHLRAYMDSISRSIAEWERAEQDAAAAARESRLQPSQQTPANG